MTKNVLDSVTVNSMELMKDSNNVYVTMVTIMGSATQHIIETQGKSGKGLVQELTGFIEVIFEEIIEVKGDSRRVSKGLVVGVLHAVSMAGCDVIEVMESFIRVVILTAIKTGGNVKEVTEGMMKGVSTGTRELGLDTASLIFVVVKTALKTAHELNSNVEKEVSESLVMSLRGLELSNSDRHREHHA